MRTALGGGKRIERHLRGAIADGVEAHLESRIRPRHRHLVQLSLLKLRQAGIPGSSEYGASSAAVRDPSEPSMKPFSIAVCSIGSSSG